ncbi:MAG: hypothetical protein KDJ77_06035, partial [Rhodobiaceae bacterium]|nr:hypothetical protein [Rhodobiaceae bacterium]
AFAGYSYTFGVVDSITLDGLTVTGGYVGIIGGGGGGIYAFANSLTILNSVVENNTTTGGAGTAKGGGVYNGIGTVTVTNSTVSGNRNLGDSDALGGGIYARGDVQVLDGSTVSGNSTVGIAASGGGIASYGFVTISNSTVSGNSTTERDADGGGIFARYSITLDNAVVSDNSVGGFNSDGGGFFSQIGFLTATDSVISGNHATYAGGFLERGGGGYVYRDAVLTRTTVSGNSTAASNGYGGGLYVVGDATLVNSTINGNSTAGVSAAGGGLRVVGSLTLTDSTLADNETNGMSALGGGAFARNVVLVNSTVTGNSTAGTYASGGGIATLSSGPTDIVSINSIVTGNTTIDGGIAFEDIGNSGLTTQGRNIIGGNIFDGAANIGSTTAAQIFAATVNNNGVDAGALANNGGPVETVALRADLANPALDAGNDSLRVEATTGFDLTGDGDLNDTITTDARGLPLVDLVGIANNGGNTSDLGAFELENQVATPETPSLIVTTDQDVVDAFDGLTSLREAIAFANSNADASTITFASGAGEAFETGGTIRLTGGQLVLTTDITIDGDLDNDGRPDITVTGDANGDDATTTDGMGNAITDVFTNTNTADNSRVFLVDAPFGAPPAVAFDGLVITGGFYQGPLSINQPGGGIRLVGSGSLTVTASSVSGNKSTRDGGGIAVVTAGSTITIAGSTVSGNQAGIEGGGVVTNSATLSVSDSTIAGNLSLGSTGGLAAIGSIASTFTTLTNVTIADNHAANFGGLNATGHLTMINSTITGNSATSQIGGAFLYATTDAVNSIILGNDAPAFAEFRSGPSVTFTSSITSGDATQIFAATQANGAATAGVLADNGGPVETVALKADAANPALDAGDDGASGVPTTDARGLARVDQGGIANNGGNTSDLGAFELQPQVLTPEAPSLIVTTDQDVVDAFDNLTSLREAIAFANTNPGADTITFDAGVFAGGGTIVLTQQLAPTGVVTIDGDINGDNVADVTLSGNDAVRIFNIEGGANVTLLSLTMSNGFGSRYSPGSAADSGGAIRSTDSTLTIMDSRITDSEVDSPFGGGFGGGISVSDGALNLTNVLIDGNAAVYGGGIFAQDAAVTLHNVTATGNNTSSGFGAVVVQRAFATATFDVANSTFVGNTGGGSAFSAELGATGSIANSVFANGTAATDVLTSGAYTASGNFVEDGSLGAGNINDGGDPLLGALADNGGTTPTLLPVLGSPLVNAGDNAAVPPGLTIAANGALRIVGGTVDIGAAETATEAPSLVVTTDQDVVDATDGLTSLREAIAFANSNPDPSAITFDPVVFAGGGTITIDPALLYFAPTTSLTIDGDVNGDNVADITLSGGGAQRHFTLTTAGIDVGLYSLNLVDGSDNVGSGLLGSGASIRAVAFGSLTIADSTISGNIASKGIGTISAHSGTLSITNSTLSGNFNNSGATVLADNTALSLTNVTIAGNTGGSSLGSAVFVQDVSAAGPGSVDISNSTFFGNAGGPQVWINDASGVVRSFGTIANSVFGDGTAAADFVNYGGYAAVTSTGNFIENGSLGVGNINDGGDPMLGVLADNGGTVQTMLPTSGSPLVNAGDNAAVPSGLTTAANGALRIIGGTVDIGAAETATEAPSLVVTTDQDVVDATDGLTSLREAIAFANVNPGADTITFAHGSGEAFESGGTIVLGGSQLTITSDVTIEGDVDTDGTPDVIIDANDASRVFVITAGDIVLDGLNLTGGFTSNNGGAINFAGSSTLTMSNGSVTDSISGNVGGGIASLGDALTLTNVTISGNTGAFGGGIYIQNDTATLTNVTLANNMATYSGGGLEVGVSGGTTLTNVTITGNIANSSSFGGGGGLNIQAGPTTLNNTIVSGNSAGANDDVFGAFGGANNLIGGTAADIFAAIDGTTNGGLLANNGGPVQTVALKADVANPALDAGDDGTAPATDARGLARFDQPG